MNFGNLPCAIIGQMGISEEKDVTEEPEKERTADDGQNKLWITERTTRYTKLKMLSVDHNIYLPLGKTGEVRRTGADADGAVKGGTRIPYQVRRGAQTTLCHVRVFQLLLTGAILEN